MTLRELETLMLTLESTPVLLARAAEGLCPGSARQRPAADGFSFVENVWHLADLEREAYAVRIRRILSEDAPLLSNFDGNRVARERAYREREVTAGIEAFAAARRANIETLRHLPTSAWNRRGVQDGHGPITLADVPRMMAEHDRSHTEDVARLLEEISAPEGTLPSHTPHRVSAFA